MPDARGTDTQGGPHRSSDEPAALPPHPLRAYSDTPRGRYAPWEDDPELLNKALAEPGTEVVAMWRHKCLVQGARIRRSAGEPAGKAVLAAAGELVLLSADGGRFVLGADLSRLSEHEALDAAGATAATGVRGLFAQLPAEESAVVARATGLLHWHRHQQYCGACGAATASRPDGLSRVCTGATCAKELFPRIEPAVIVLVEAPGDSPACLLARHHGAGEDNWSLLAGFVEVGDSLEGAVRRELAEEAGVDVADVTYQTSQAWPFPAGMMIGFRARARTGLVQVDRQELVEARWFTRDEVAERATRGPGLGPVDSIGHFLLNTWLHESP